MCRAVLTAAVMLTALASRVWAADEVIIRDPANGVVITRSIVAEMVQADAQAASLFGLPAPGPDAEEQLTAALRSDYATTQTGIKAMMAHAHRDLPLGWPYLASRSAESRAAFVARMKPEVLDAPTAGSRLLNLDEVLIGLGEKSVKATARGGEARFGAFTRSQDRAQHAFQQGVRSSFTSCNTYNGSMERNWAFCHP